MMVLHVQDAGPTLSRLVDDDEANRSPIDANRFLEALDVRGLSRYTIRAYAFDLLILYRWLDRVGKQLGDLRESDLVGFIIYQKHAGTRPRSINRRLSTCRLFFRFITGKDLEANAGSIAVAPYFRGRGRDRSLGLHILPVVRPRLRVKTPRSLVEPLSADQVRSFIRTIKRYRDLAIVYLMLLCGLRSKEVLDIALKDIDFTEGHLRIHGKGDKERLLPLPETLLSALNDYMRLERPRRPRQPYLFLILQGRRRGDRMTSEGLRSLFRHRRLKPEIANANAHRFRHTFGADMARAGEDIPKLPKYLPRPLPPDVDVEIQRRLLASGCTYKLGLALMRRTGIRSGELRSLEYDCTRADHLRNKFLKVPLGKLYNERLVPVDEDTVALIAKLQKRGPHPRAFLLFRPSGAKAHYEPFRRALADAALGLDGQGPITTHRLRHTFATTLLNGGMSLVGLMRLLGHRTFAMTLRYAAITTETMGTEYFQAIGKLEKRYKIERGPREIADHDPLKMLADVARWLRTSTDGDRPRKRHARMLAKRLDRIRAAISKMPIDPEP